MSTVFTKKFSNSKACHVSDTKKFDWIQKAARMELAITLLNEMTPNTNYIVRYQESDETRSNQERIYTLYAWLGIDENKNQSSDVVKK